MSPILRLMSISCKISQNTTSSFSNPHIRWENIVLVEPLRVAGWWHHPPPKKKCSQSHQHMEAIRNIFRDLYIENYTKSSQHPLVGSSAGGLPPLVGCCGSWLGIHTATGPPTVEALFNAWFCELFEWAFFVKGITRRRKFRVQNKSNTQQFWVCIYKYLFACSGMRIPIWHVPMHKIMKPFRIMLGMTWPQELIHYSLWHLEGQ